MAKAAWELDVCKGCTTFTPEGQLTFVGSHGCGISATTVGPLLINEEYPEVAAAVNACEGPVEREFRHRGLLGLLGVKAKVKLCPAVSLEDLQRIAADQADWHDSVQAGKGI